MANDIKGWYEEYQTMVSRRCQKVLYYPGMRYVPFNSKLHEYDDDVQEATQDVFLKLLKAKEPIKYPSTWLWTTATTVCLNMRRRERMKKNKLGIQVPLEGDVEIYNVEGNFEEKVDAKLLVQAIKQIILDEESEISRAICFMHFFDGETLEKIGETVEMSTSGVEKRLKAMIKKIRKKLDGEAKMKKLDKEYLENMPMVTQRCQRVLHRFATRNVDMNNFHKLDEDVKDAVQDVFLKLLKAKEPVKYPSTYLFNAATSVCLNKLRAERTRKNKLGIQVPFEDDEEIYGIKGSFEEVERKSLVQAVKQIILDEESEISRAICFMYFFDGLTLEKIAEIVGISTSGVEKRLKAMEKKIRKKLDGDAK